MGSKYEIIIFWSDEDDAFVAEVPELPGCMADGSTYQEALSNISIQCFHSLSDVWPANFYGFSDIHTQ